MTDTAAPPPAAPRRRIGIVMLSAVGDAVHALPVVNALKRHDPGCHVTWVMQPGPAMLVRGHPAVDEIVLFDRARGWRGFLDVRKALTQPFDLLLDLQVYFKAGVITALAHSPVKLGFDRARAHDLNWLFTNRKIAPHPLQHVQDQYLEFLSALGVPAEPVRWDLGPWPQERAYQQGFVARFDRPIAALVIGSSKPQKDWFPERWAALADALYHDFHVQPVLAGGRSPRELATERIIMESAKAPVVSALGSGLRNLVGILDASALVVSLDTGPLHMTVALDRPVISLIGYSNPKRVGPYRRFHDLIVDAYGEPGEDYPISMENRLDRMPRIAVSNVLERVERWRRDYAGSSPRKS